MKSGLLLNVVVRQCTPILQLFASKNQSLLIRRNPLLVLDLGLHIVDRVTCLYVECDRLARQGLDKYLHGVQSMSGKCLDATLSI